MKKVFLPGMIAAAMSTVIGGSSVFGQSSGYSNGLSSSAYPVYQNPTAQQTFIPASGTVGTGATRFAQLGATVPPNHVHIPPGNYSLGNGAAAPQNLPAPAASATMQASGTVEQYPGAIQSQPGVPQPYAGGYAGSAPAPVAADNDAYGYGDTSIYGQQPSYSSALPSFVGSGFGNCQTCAPAAPAMVPAVVSPRPWIFGANALLFSRVDSEYHRFASDANMPTTALLSTRNVDFGTVGGYELYGGRYFGCGRFAVMGSYWSLNPGAQSYAVNNTTGYDIRTNVPFTSRGVIDPNSYTGIELPTSNVYARYDATYAQRLVRNENFQSAEINFFSFALGGAARAGVAQVPACSPCGDGCGSPAASSCITGPTGACAPIYGARCSRLRFAPLAGFRWFRYDDNLEYSASMTDQVYGTTADDVYYRNNVTNNLYGFQLGGIATYCTGHRFSLMAGAKAGVFANHINYNSYAGTATQAATVMSNNSYFGQPYSFMVSDNDVAFIGEGNLGVNVCLCRGWSANVGYRLIGIGGLATAPGQIPKDFGLLNDAQRIYRDQSIILQGLTLGAAYNW